MRFLVTLSIIDLSATGLIGRQTYIDKVSDGDTIKVRILPFENKSIKKYIFKDFSAKTPVDIEQQFQIVTKYSIIQLINQFTNCYHI
jgi:hypothetical protein